ncbi:hypothetical protein BDR26DRAFT_71059 [Obelidium mucronatum]|nr:hypothetical protein BDR26DRAFT_71059 [Obelidium mucronatum]
MDAKKYIQATARLAAILEAEEDWSELLAVWGEVAVFVLDPAAKEYSEAIVDEFALHLKSVDASSVESPQIHLLQKLIHAQETHDAETFERQVELRRRRLGAADLNTTRRIVESEIVLVSRLDQYYSQLLTLLDTQKETNETSSSIDSLSSSIRGKLLIFLNKKIKHIANPQEKSVMASNIKKLAERILDDTSDSDSNFVVPGDGEEASLIVAFEFLLNSTDCGSSEYDLQLMESVSRLFPYKAAGLAASGYVKWRTEEEFTVDEALDDLNESFELKNQSVFASHILSTMLHESKDYESCIGVSKKALVVVAQFQSDYGIVLDRVSQSIEMTLAQAYCKIGSKFHQDAVALYSRIIDREPENIAALLGLSNAYFIVQKYQEALERLYKVVELDATNDSAISDIGWIKFQMFDATANSGSDGSGDSLEDCLRLLQSALELNDCAVHNYRVGKVLWAIGGESRVTAYTYFLKSVKQDPRTPGSFTAIGLFCLSVDQNRDRAKKCFQKALEVDATDAEAVIELVKLYLQEEEEEGEGGVEAAKTALLEFASLNSRSAVVWRYLGFISLKNKEYPDSITYFQSSLRLDTQSVSSWEGLGEAYSEEGKYMAALKAFTRAHELNPASIFSVYQSAQIKFKLGLFNDANTDFKSVKEFILNNNKEVGESGGDMSGFLVPCLKSMAECNLYAARESFSLGSFGICIDQLNTALDACITVVTLSTQYQSIFKILGDVAMSFYVFKSRHVAELVDLGVLENGLRVLGCEVNGDDTEESETNDDSVKIYTRALDLAIAAYKIAIHICSNHSSNSAAAAFQTLKPAYLHDLAMAYHYLYNVTKQEKHLKCSLASLWKALHLDPENQELWNSLGCVVFHVNLKVAQHAFVKAVELNEKNVEAWTNLGYFYYFNGDFDLAKQCFHRAQLIDPETCLSWYGQALINQSTAAAASTQHGNKEPTAATALDLFDHANDLSQGQNLEIGYSYAYSEYQKHTSSFSFKALLEQDSSVLAVPVFSMIKFCEASANDAAGFTLLGLLREKQGVFGEAVAAFGKAVEICRKQGRRGGKEELEQCLANYARALCSAGMYGESIEVYKEFRQVTEVGGGGGDTVLTRVGFGLALFFEERYEESLTLFQEALNILSGMEAPDVSLQNNVGLLLSQVLFALGADVHLGLAKEQLLACLQRGVSFPQALMSLLALGIVSQNDELAQEAAAELIKEKPDTMMIGGLRSRQEHAVESVFLVARR